jgi:hypothetical protein
LRPELVFVGIGLLSIVIGLPLADRRIPPNRWYGVRVRATFADEHVWYEANAQAGRDLTGLGVLFVVLAIVLADRLPPAQYVMWCGPVFVLGSLLLVVRSLRLANRLWRERGNGGRGPNGRQP